MLLICAGPYILRRMFRSKDPIICAALWESVHVLLTYTTTGRMRALCSRVWLFCLKQRHLREIGCLGRINSALYLFCPIIITRQITVQICKCWHTNLETQRLRVSISCLPLFVWSLLLCPFHWSWTRHPLQLFPALEITLWYSPVWNCFPGCLYRQLALQPVRSKVYLVPTGSFLIPYS